MSTKKTNKVTATGVTETPEPAVGSGPSQKSSSSSQTPKTGTSSQALVFGNATAETVVSNGTQRKLEQVVIKDTDKTKPNAMKKATLGTKLMESATNTRKLRSLLKTQNHIMNKLFKEIDSFGSLKTTTRSEKIKESITNLVEIATELDTNRIPFHRTIQEVCDAAEQATQIKNVRTTSSKNKPTHSLMSSPLPPAQDTEQVQILNTIQDRLNSQDGKLEAIMASLPAIQTLVQTYKQKPPRATLDPAPEIPQRGTPSSVPITAETQWTTIKRRLKKERKKTQPRGRPDVVIVKGGNLTYSDMLKKIKAGKEVQAAGNNICAVTETREGHLRVVLNRGATDVESLTEAISRTIGNGVTCTKLSDTTKIEIRDADEEATDEEVVQAIEEAAGSPISVRIFSKRKVGRGLQTIIASVPSSAANTVTTSKLRIGYVNCRVRCMIDVKKCYKCQGYGHTRDSCTAAERSNVWWNCGLEGHKSRDCTNPAKCVLCNDEVSDDHALGSYKCHAYRRALEAAKKKQ